MYRGAVGAGLEALHIASFGRRFVAVIIDVIVLAVFSQVVGQFLKGGHVLNEIVAIGWTPLVGALYFTLFEGGASGQTPGKRALKIRVVDVQDDVSIGYIRALLRFIVSWVSLIVLFIGYLSMLGEPSGQTWHDIAARSLVVDWPRAGPPSD